MPNSTLESQVHESLDNSVENGYGDAMAEMTDAQVADDLIQLDCALEGYTQVDLVPHVQTWRQKQ
jgi:hypothetical protein